MTKMCKIMDNEFNRHWYSDIIGRYYTPTECPPYANFMFVYLTTHDHPSWSHEAAYGPCTK